MRIPIAFAVGIFLNESAPVRKNGGALVCDFYEKGFLLTVYYDYCNKSSIFMTFVIKFLQGVGKWITEKN